MNEIINIELNKLLPSYKKVLKGLPNFGYQATRDTLRQILINSIIEKLPLNIELIEVQQAVRNSLV